MSQYFPDLLSRIASGFKYWYSRPPDTEYIFENKYTFSQRQAIMDKGMENTVEDIAIIIEFFVKYRPRKFLTKEYLTQGSF